MSVLVLPVDGIVINTARVEPEWIDYNGHMNVAYFMKIFELGIDSYKALVGMDAAYIAGRQRSTVALESHITYQQEAALGDDLRLETRLLGCDGKRVHVYQELHRGRDLLATQETLAISFDIAARRVCDLELDLARNYAALVAAQSHLPRPRWIGRAINLGPRKPAA